MRISQLIKLLEDYKRKHGDQHVRAYNRRGDDGKPVVEERTTFRSGDQRPMYRAFVTSDTPD